MGIISEPQQYKPLKHSFLLLEQNHSSRQTLLTSDCQGTNGTPPYTPATPPTKSLTSKLILTLSVLILSHIAAACFISPGNFYRLYHKINLPEVYWRYFLTEIEVISTALRECFLTTFSLLNKNQLFLSMLSHDTPPFLHLMFPQ